MIMLKRLIAASVRAPTGRGLRARADSRGAVLITGLLILAVMTVLGVSSMRGTVLEERMAGNLKEQTASFQAAEAGIQAALTAIEKKPLPPVANAWGAGSLGEACRVVDRDADTACLRLGVVLSNWKGTAAPTAGVRISGYGASDLGGLSTAQQPRILVESRYSAPADFEAMAQGRGIHYYTVSALGTGPSGQSEIILQTTIAKVYAW
jgi:type IV pilus assembly protein PilX